MLDSVLFDAMDKTRGVTPIFKLNQDTLWNIFMMNADLKNEKMQRVNQTYHLPGWAERALVVTWSSSHVCHWWRELILRSPSLWGRIIDLDILAMVKPQWREEIMRRTGSASLTVKGHVFAQYGKEQDFLVHILQDHWLRIQSLDVRMTRAHKFPNHIWDVIRRPAPVLRAFHLEALGSPILFPSTVAQLFANEAPAIQDFQTYNLDFRITSEIRWLSGIRRLEIVFSSSMSVTNWLQVLEQMPNIEYLALAHAFHTPLNPDNEISTSLHLPRLAEIILSNNLRGCIVLLAQIIPKIGCGLSMKTPPYQQLLTLDLTLATRVLSRYSSNFFNNHIAETLYLSVSHTGFIFGKDRDRHFSGPDGTPGMRIEVYGHGLVSGLPMILHLLEAFSSCNFSKVTTIEIQASLFSYQTLGPTIHRLLASLESVETLLTFSDGLSALHSLEYTSEPDHNSDLPILPKLQVVKVRPEFRGASLGNIAILHPFKAQEFIPFLALRRQSVAPVEVLDLTGWRDFDRLDIFDGLAGLKVVYHDGQGIQQYICGGNLKETSLQ